VLGHLMARVSFDAGVGRRAEDPVRLASSRLGALASMDREQWSTKEEERAHASVSGTDNTRVENRIRRRRFS
jgi:hypothetical protein